MIPSLIEITLIALSISLIASIFIVCSQRWHGKHTLDHDLEGIQKFHTTAVPRIGGLAIVAAVGLTLTICGFGKFDTFFHISRDNIFSAGLLTVAAVPAFVAGMVEDTTKKVSVRIRLVASMLSAVLASWLIGATVHELDIWGIDTLLKWTPIALIVTVIVVSGGVNAVNIIDGFNGLAGAIVVVMLVALGAIGWGCGDMLIVELAALGVGSTAGFLLINYPAGRLFLGDGGAYFLGFWVAEIAVLLLVRNPNVSAWQVLSVCAYPIIEVMFSIYRRRFVRKSNPGSPDCLHLHTLVYRRVVTRYIPLDRLRPWKRNAAVTCIILPWIIVCAYFSVVGGVTIFGAVTIVTVQTFIYVFLYARIVRGRWGSAIAAPTLKSIKKVNMEGNDDNADSLPVKITLGKIH